MDELVGVAIGVLAEVLWAAVEVAFWWSRPSRVGWVLVGLLGVALVCAAFAVL